MSEARLRDELCRIGRSLHARGYVHGTTGNVSARLHARARGLAAGDDEAARAARDERLGDAGEQVLEARADVVRTRASLCRGDRLRRRGAVDED